ncbi:hypothetical protein OBBRIDRAFT_801870 [Obba rivulosa]|uniref:Uncharacterized protein n=1 Tax=Obba rivulosa TaxID=1052685 RepID=A0A8E2J544_9APHY|nr:hypothetical protein OBBRIDRAFT_801870 [Obba rivulosa]
MKAQALRATVEAAPAWSASLYNPLELQLNCVMSEFGLSLVAKVDPFDMTDAKIQAKLDKLSRLPTQSFGRSEWLSHQSASNLARPTTELAHRTPVLRKLEMILRAPYSSEPLLPMFHYGYPISIARLQELAADVAYTADAEGYNDLTATIRTLNHIAGEVMDHPARLQNDCQWCEARRIGFQPEEIVPKFKEYLGERENPKWYLDREQWFWRF